ncbi:hypothetical protein LINPERPRIM_LOCUS27429 [Linum perenne]
MEEMMTSDATYPPPVPLPDFILSMEQATQLAKQLPSTADPTHLRQIYSALHLAHHHLSSFLQSHPPENSVSSATGAGEEEDNSGEPMQVGEDEAEEENSIAATITKVEEKMRDCFIKNKRPKRPLSPSSAADDGYASGTTAIKEGFDPFETRVRALELIDQFHA